MKRANETREKLNRHIQKFYYPVEDSAMLYTMLNILDQIERQLNEMKPNLTNKEARKQYHALIDLHEETTKALEKTILNDKKEKLKYELICLRMHRI